MRVGTLTAFLCATGLSVCLAESAAADGVWDHVGSSWSCTCLTYAGGSENCHMFASGHDGAFSFGAFETSGEGTYSVEDSATEMVVTGKIRTITDQDMTVVIVQPKAGGPADVFIDTRTAGDADFTAACANE